MVTIISAHGRTPCRRTACRPTPPYSRDACTNADERSETPAPESTNDLSPYHSSLLPSCVSTALRVPGGDSDSVSMSHLPEMDKALPAPAGGHCHCWRRPPWGHPPQTQSLRAVLRSALHPAAVLLSLLSSFPGFLQLLSQLLSLRLSLSAHARGAHGSLLTAMTQF